MSQPGRTLLAACDLLTAELQLLRVGAIRTSLSIGLSLVAAVALLAGLVGAGAALYLAVAPAWGPAVAALLLGLAALACAGLLARLALGISR